MTAISAGLCRGVARARVKSAHFGCGLAEPVAVRLLRRAHHWRKFGLQQQLRRMSRCTSSGMFTSRLARCSPLLLLRCDVKETDSGTLGFAGCNGSDASAVGCASRAGASARIPSFERDLKVLNVRPRRLGEEAPARRKW